MADTSDRSGGRGNNQPVEPVLDEALAVAGEEAEAEQRRARRLASDLGVNPAGVQVILRLRRQVVMLQGQVRQMESALRVERRRTDARLTSYRREYHEASWEDTL
jgi:hypothetical protein